MIDLLFLRKYTDAAVKALKKKDPTFPIEQMLSLDIQVRELRLEVEALRQKRNEQARMGARGADEIFRAQARSLHEALKEKEAVLEEVQESFQNLYLRCPNIPSDDVPIGDKEANQVVRSYGQKPEFEFEPLNHVELNEQVKWFDMATAARMAGSQFVFYLPEGAHLLYTLALFMMSHNKKYGYSLVTPPYVVNEEALQGASNFPRFRDAVYAIPEDGLYLTPTSEVNLTSVYREHTFSSQELPVRMTSWTSCFRREAGAYGASERGLIRVHQFEKVELYTLCTPEQAQEEHERMMACAEGILQQLGLHYRVSLLAAQDSSFAAAKTYDIEVWLPGQKEYREVSSSSWCSDFQARRSSIRYKGDAGKTHFVHTLNTSSLALSRVMVALMETYQQKDGTIALPPILDQIVWMRRER